MKNILYQESIVEIKHLFRVMKITALALFLFVGTAFATKSYSQTMKVTVVSDRISTGKVINEIEKQTDYLFVYDMNEVNLKRNVKVHAQDKPVAEVLNEVFEGTDIYYAMEGKNIMLMNKAKEKASEKQADDNKVTGSIKDMAGEPIIGANVTIKGQSIGTITDIDGRFIINAPANAILRITYIGYIPQEIKVENKRELKIILQEDTETLDEVVVVGYGVQKKSVVTASIAKVSSEDLENKSPVRMDNALKGLAAGVDVTSASGQPGDSPRVRVRGIGTINNSDPLYIVDGMPIGGGLDFVNPNDIESIEVLKDAASGAIYGARAANGVILVTTKKGKMGKAQINYNFSYGWQSAWKRRDVTSATDYAILQNEANVNGGQAPIYADPYNLIDANGNSIKGFGTDWQDLVFYDNAPVVNHDVTVSGASEKVNYYLSLGYYSQDGIVGGNHGHSNYDRLTIRSNTQYNLIDASKERGFLNKLDLGVNLAYMRTHSTGVGTNSEFGSILGSALYLSPILTPTLTGDAAEKMIETYKDFERLIRKFALFETFFAAYCEKYNVDLSN